MTMDVFRNRIKRTYSARNKSLESEVMIYYASV
jgi:hypothetical protein